MRFFIFLMLLANYASASDSDSNTLTGGKQTSKVANVWQTYDADGNPVFTDIKPKKDKNKSLEISIDYVKPVPSLADLVLPDKIFTHQTGGSVLTLPAISNILPNALPR